jgi:Allene oxide cyclase barrel like domain
MRKLILPILAVALAAITLTSLSPASAHPKDHAFTVTTKTIGETPVDKTKPPKLGDTSVITEDVYVAGKKIGTSDLTCTLVRLDLAQHFFAAECFNTTVLPGGQITAQGYVTSDQIEKVPFKQAITGGTGVYIGAKGELTVDEAGDGPAHLTFALVR